MGRGISLKTPHRPNLKPLQPVPAAPASISNSKSSRGQAGTLKSSIGQGSNEPPSPSLSYRSDSVDMPPPSRPSVLGSLFGGVSEVFRQIFIIIIFIIAPWDQVEVGNECRVLNLCFRFGTLSTFI